MSDTAPSSKARMTIGHVSGRAFWVLLSTVGTLVIGYAAWLVTARGLGPAESGVLAILQYESVVATQLLAIGVHYSILYYASRGPRRRPAVVGLARVQTAVLAVIAIGGVLLF